jgi:hypothetical protein
LINNARLATDAKHAGYSINKFYYHHSQLPSSHIINITLNLI